MKSRIVQAKLAKRTGLEVLDQNVRTKRQLSYNITPRRRAEVEHDGSLSTIASMEVGRILAYEGRPPTPRVVTCWAFDLDDLCTEVSKRLADPGSSQDARQFKNTEAGERRSIDLASHLDI